MVKILVLFSLLITFEAQAQTNVDSHFCVSQYKNFDSAKGDYRTWCPGMEPLDTANVNEHPQAADFDLVTQKIASKNYHFVGAFFHRYSILLHVDHVLAPSEQYCILAYEHVEKGFLSPGSDKYYLDCSDGELRSMENLADTQSCLGREQLTYVATLPQKLEIALGNNNIDPVLYIYKRARK